MIDEPVQPTELPDRLLELAQMGAEDARKSATWTVIAGLGFWAASLGIALLRSGNLLQNPFAIGGTVLVLFSIMVFRAERSFGPIAELGPAIRGRQIVWVACFPERLGRTKLLFLNAPRRRWTVQLTSAKAQELLELLRTHASSIHIEPYDGKRFRRWVNSSERVDKQRLTREESE